MSMKKLYRSPTDTMVAGVVGGIAEYFALDSTLLRVIWILILVFTGVVPGVVAYILAAIVMPLPPAHEHNGDTHKEHSGQHHP